MIKAENVIVEFKKGLLKKKFKALDGFTLDVNRGDIFGLLGPNGAGKSTAMYCFLGLIRPDRGSVQVFGAEPLPGAKIFRKIAYLPEEPHYHLYLTVQEAVSYYASLYGNGIGRARVDEAIDRVGLSGFRDMRLSKCSKGMKQKVGIAQCLAGEPELVMLDEPTRGLDPMTVRKFRDILVEMNKRGVTVILNSHVLSEIEMICNRVAVMNRGKVIAVDELDRLRNMNTEIYAVEIQRSDTLPDYMTVLSNSQDTVRGEIPAEHLAGFVQFAGTSGLTVYECSLKKLSLEDAFFNIMNGES